MEYVMRTGFWMHENCKDVCIELLKFWQFKAGFYTLKVRWWVLGYTGNPYYSDVQETIEIKKEDWKKWHDITNRMQVKRSKPGLP